MNAAELPRTARASSSPLRQTGSPDFVALGSVKTAGPLFARARLLGARVDTRDIAADGAAAALAPGAGLTFVFRYGVAVTIGTGDEPLGALDTALRAHVADPTDVPETESARLAPLNSGADRIGPDGSIELSDASPERLLLAATVLARSVVLSRDEVLVSEAFDRIAPLVADLRENGRTRLPIRPAMRLAGEVLSARHRVMGSAQVDERPDILWDHPGLDRLYARLEDEYELEERAEVLQRKYGALGDFTEVLLDIVQVKRAHRTEVAIIALIAFEIMLTLAQLAGWIGG